MRVQIRSDKKAISSSTGKSRPSDREFSQSSKHKRYFERVLKEKPESIWSSRISASTRDAIQAFKCSLRLANGLRFGESVRSLDLTDKTAHDIDQYMEKIDCKKSEIDARDPITGKILRDSSGKSTPMVVYVCADGGIVRVKPLGDPSSPYRGQPHAIKALRFPAESQYETFDDEVLKVDNESNPIPKWSKDLNSVFEDSLKQFKFIEGWAETAHTDLVPRPLEEYLKSNLYLSAPGHSS